MKFLNVHVPIVVILVFILAGCKKSQEQIQDIGIHILDGVSIFKPAPISPDG